MARESFCLTWNFFHQHASGFLEIESSEKNFADVTLVSDEQKPFEAHKFVLSACSPVLRDLLLKNPHDHPVIYLNGIKQFELDAILQFIYLGNSKFHQSRIDRFIETGRILQLKQFARNSNTNANADKERNGHDTDPGHSDISQLVEEDETNVNLEKVSKQRVVLSQKDLEDESQVVILT